MAIPVARVHLAMAHAALPGLLPTPPKCTMLPLLPAPPPCAAAAVLPSSAPKPSRADAAGRWDAHKNKINKQTGSPASTSSSSSSDALDGKNHLTTRTSSTSSSNSRADSDERWDAHKKPPAASLASSSSSSASSSSKTKRCRHISKRLPNNGRASTSSAAERWDAHKKPPVAELDDGESSSTGSNDVELDMLMPQQPTPRSLYYAGPGFIAAPEPSMLPLPSFLISVA
ncbi:hypothetical protein HU200_054451 [Digitaria exilis]|uniref:Uncharacterized protein n=1 Tax=Digitaria exilis TaxID=1010633 RepID=A0A835AFU9_9POAL|nr:hypothetical protein HU200_054451 [Digitaria exilis]